MLKDKNRIIVYLLIFIIIMIVGGSYAFFVYERSSNTTTKIKTGDLLFSFVEGDQVQLSNVYPLSDAIGATNENSEYKFNVSMNSSSSNISMRYTITLLSNNYGNNIFRNDQIKIALIKNNTYVAGTSATKGIKLSEIEGFDYDQTSGEGEILYEQEIHTGDIDQYKLRMWISDDVSYNNEENENGFVEGKYNNYTYSLKVRVNAFDSTTEFDNLNIKTDGTITIDVYDKNGLDEYAFTNSKDMPNDEDWIKFEDSMANSNIRKISSIKSISLQFKVQSKGKYYLHVKNNKEKVSTKEINVVNDIDYENFILLTQAYTTNTTLATSTYTAENDCIILTVGITVNTNSASLTSASNYYTVEADGNYQEIDYVYNQYGWSKESVGIYQLDKGTTFSVSTSANKSSDNRNYTAIILFADNTKVSPIKSIRTVYYAHSTNKNSLSSPEYTADDKYYMLTVSLGGGTSSGYSYNGNSTITTTGSQLFLETSNLSNAKSNIGINKLLNNDTFNITDSGGASTYGFHVLGAYELRPLDYYESSTSIIDNLEVFDDGSFNIDMFDSLGIESYVLTSSKDLPTEEEWTNLESALTTPTRFSFNVDSKGTYYLHLKNSYIKYAMKEITIDKVDKNIELPKKILKKEDLKVLASSITANTSWATSTYTAENDCIVLVTGFTGNTNDTSYISTTNNFTVEADGFYSEIAYIFNKFAWANESVGIYYLEKGTTINVSAKATKSSYNQNSTSIMMLADNTKYSPVNKITPVYSARTSNRTAISHLFESEIDGYLFVMTASGGTDSNITQPTYSDDDFSKVLFKDIAYSSARTNSQLALYDVSVGDSFTTSLTGCGSSYSYNTLGLYVLE